MTNRTPGIETRSVVLLVALLTISACQPQTVAPPAIPPPGGTSWGEPVVACTLDDDCLGTEMCVDAVCQLKRCQDGPYASAPPIGTAHIFFDDHELIVADTDKIGAYAPSDTDAVAAGTFDFSGQTVVDVAGGNVIAGRPDEMVAAVSGQTVVHIFNETVSITLDVGFAPIGVATVDTDGDSIDEVAAISLDGRVAVCNAADNTCRRFDYEGVDESLDIASADMDIDGFEELIALMKSDGEHYVMVINTDHNETGQADTWGFIAGESLHKVAAADLDGDRMPEILGLHDSGCGLFGCGSDRINVYYTIPEDAQKLGEWTTNTNAVDLTIADFDADDSPEVVVLLSDERVRVVDNTFADLFEAALTAENDPNRIAVVDADGDSPQGKLVEGPKMLFGRPVPTFNVYYPPYWREYSDTPANVYVGRSDLETQTETDMVSLSAGVEVGVEADFLGLFSAGISTKLKQTVSESYSTRKVQFVGDKVWSQARPDVYGSHYGGVMVSYTCAHQYDYVLDDPAGKVGGDGGKFTLVLPVDGATTFLSTMRYNALAEALGGLPIMNVPHTIGDPTSYPNVLQSVDGKEIPTEDLVVNDPPTYLVSDIAFVGFWYAAWDYVGYETAYKAEVGVQGALSVPGFKFGAEVGQGWGESYSIEIGEESFFGGLVPTLPDDPATPSDEYATNAYTFAPIIYKEHYQDDEGNDASYYVYHFMVGQ